MDAFDDLRRRLQRPAPAAPREPLRLPAARFTGRAAYEAERAAVFGRAWLLAGRLDEIARPGLYMTWEKTVVPLLIVHAVDGVVRGFYNSCRHRGAPVVRVPRGRNRALRCQYHSWTYDTSGKLVSVPDERDFVDLRREERGLVPVACEVASGAIFLSEDPAGDLTDWFGGLTGELGDGAGLDGLRTLDQRSTTIAANWKRVLARLLAAPPAPPRPQAGVPPTAPADVEALAGGHLRIVAPFTAAGAAALGLADPLAWAALEDEGLAPIPGLAPMLASTHTTYALFPNLLLTFTPGGVLALAAWPAAAGATLLDATWYAPDWGEEDAPRDLPAWRERLDWTQALLDGLAQDLAGDLAGADGAVEEEAEAVRRWYAALDDALAR